MAKITVDQRVKLEALLGPEEVERISRLPEEKKEPLRQWAKQRYEAIKKKHDALPIWDEERDRLHGRSTIYFATYHLLEGDR